jgi:multiple sugar transport system permease protein
VGRKRRRRVGASALAAERRWGLLFALPAILGFLGFALFPMLFSLAMSFTDWTIVGRPRFAGGEAYRQVTSDPLFARSLWASTYYTLGSVPVVLLTALGVALLLNTRVRGLAVWRTIFYLPSIVPGVASSILWLWLYNPDFGLLNLLLKRAGLPKLDWIFGESTAMPSLILMSAWGMGNMMVVFLAGLQSVPQHLYEALEVDGGGPWHKFRHVTLPLISPILFFNAVMATIGALQVFTQAYIMTNGGPNYATHFLVYMLFRRAFTYGQMGQASALAWIMFAIILTLTALIFRSARWWVYYEGATV